MRYTAKHKQADVGARKIRPFATLIRGRNVDDALEQLRYIPNRGAKQLAAVIKSAVGNAEEQGCQSIDDLIVTEARIDDGPMFKRIRPRARGTAFMIKRRMSHIIVSLNDYEDIHPEGHFPESASTNNDYADEQPALTTTAPAEMATSSSDDDENTPAKAGEGDTGHQGEEEKAPSPNEEQQPDGDDNAPAAEGEEVPKSDETKQ